MNVEKVDQKFMKKILLTISVLVNLVLIMGANYPVKEDNKQNVVKKASTCGYTIVEFGKGVNCQGDTILLVKKKGLQMQAEEAHQEAI